MTESRHPRKQSSSNQKTSAVVATALNTLANIPQGLAGMFRRRYPTIAVTGISGVGKTNLVDNLSKRASSPVALDVGSTVMERRTRKSARFRGFRFLVVPGDNAATRLNALEEVFHDHPVDGVIHVVANGHASPRRSGGSGSLLHPDREELLAAELEDWVITAHRIAAMAVKRDSPIWLIIAVNKIDLYPTDVDKALDYYSPRSGSTFGTKVDELRALVGDAKIWIDVLAVCSPTPGSNDRSDQVRSAESLGQMITRLEHLSGQL